MTKLLIELDTKKSKLFKNNYDILSTDKKSLNLIQLSFRQIISMHVPVGLSSRRFPTDHFYLSFKLLKAKILDIELILKSDSIVRNIRV